MKKIAIYENDIINDAGNKPSYFPLVAGYLRGFRSNRHTRTDDSMPGDKKMTLATRHLYAKATMKERAVMIGADIPELTPRERSKIFTVLCFKLAREAHLTATILLPDDTERKNENESDEHPTF